ncbi:MAG: hypothetical protein V2I97_00305 [Desulfococcaceae bacterium]|jgi:spermidine synthase|nr:hypothetical protein [Desulfococcaceae bacterium]
MNNGLYALDRSGQSFANYFQIEQVLYDSRSKYQKITVFDTADCGRILMLDNFFNVSTPMEAFYHEPMSHVPLGLAGRRRNVLIIGGGDFGVARHVVKHRDVEALTLCELDGQVLDVCREFFPDWAVCEKDPRMQVRVGDGAAYLKDCPPHSLDALIIDSTDPFFNASVLVTEDFYDAAYRALQPEGVLIQIVADYYFYKKIWPDVLSVIKGHFPACRPLFFYVPFYVLGSWGLLLAGKKREQLRPEKITREYLDSIGGVETLTPEIVAGAFSLPPYIRNELKDFL